MALDTIRNLFITGLMIYFCVKIEIPCDTPIKLYYLGNWILIFFFFAAILFQETMEDRYPQIIPVIQTFLYTSLFFSFFFWTMCGFYWITKNYLVGNNCMGGFFTFLILLMQMVIIKFYFSVFFIFYHALKEMFKKR